MKKSSLLEINEILKKDEKNKLEANVAYAALVGITKKTIVVLPSKNQIFIPLNCLEAIISDIKMKAAGKNLLVKIIPKQWRIYICHNAALAMVDLKNGEFEVVGLKHITDHEMRDRIEIELDKQADYLGILYEDPEADKPEFENSNTWETDEPILLWNGWNNWTTGDSFEHTFAFGRSGSGKTSSIFQFASQAMLRAGYGCLFQTTKKDDAKTYKEWVKMAGRKKSLVELNVTSRLGCNLIKQEMDYGASKGDCVDVSGNVVQLFKFVSAMAGGTNERRGQESIWDAAAQELLRNALNLVYAATDTVKFDELREVIKSAPQSKNEVEDKVWQRKSLCWHYMEKALENKPESRGVKLALDYFQESFPQLAPETRTSVTFNFSAGWADLLSREPLYSLFFSDSHYQMNILLEGAILLINLPIDEYDQVGRLANGLARWAAQKTVDRRDDSSKSERPVAVIWDECQKTLCKADISFLETARSRRCAFVAGAQNLPLLHDAVGKELAEGMIGNCNTLLFYQNRDPETNKLMTKSMGTITSKEVISETRDSKGKLHKTWGKKTRDAFPPEKAFYLKTGGEKNRLIVKGILNHGGKEFGKILGLIGGSPGLIVRFHQERPVWSRLNYLTCTTAACAKQRPAPDFRHIKRP